MTPGPWKIWYAPKPKRRAKVFAKHKQQTGLIEESGKINYGRWRRSFLSSVHMYNRWSTHCPKCASSFNTPKSATSVSHLSPPYASHPNVVFLWLTIYSTSIYWHSDNAQLEAAPSTSRSWSHSNGWESAHPQIQLRQRMHTNDLVTQTSTTVFQQHALVELPSK